MGAWSYLSIDLLLLIAERISEHTDLLRFGSVCKSWRSVMLSNVHQLPHKLPLCHCLPRRQPLPMLIHFYEKESVATVDFLSLMDQKRYGRFYVPEVRHKWIPGSSHGWLVTMEAHGQEIRLLNPFTRAQLELPSLSAFTFPFRHGSWIGEINGIAFVNKVILSTEPNSRNYKDCIILATITGSRVLSFCRLGDEKWTNIEESPIHIEDVIPYKDQFYIIADRGGLVACDPANNMRLTAIAGISDNGWGARYLLVSPSGELLQVVKRHVINKDRKTHHFIVYKLVAVDEAEMEGVREVICFVTSSSKVVKQRGFRFRWVILKNLGDQTLFIGRNSSLSLPASSYPGCKANCIYFSNDKVTHTLKLQYPDDDDYLDMGVYNLEDKSIQRFAGANYDPSFILPPIWITPNPF